MAITVGTDSYISHADANSYWEFNFEEGLPADGPGNDLLKKATIAIDRLYGSRFIGWRVSSNPLSWPRNSASNSRTGRRLESIPKEVADATAEMAYLIYNGEDVYTQPGPLVKDESIQVDVISISNTFAGTYQDKSTLSKIELILAPVLTGGNGLRLVK